jgi:hypothetical protein
MYASYVRVEIERRGIVQRVVFSAGAAGGSGGGSGGGDCGGQEIREVEDIR